MIPYLLIVSLLWSSVNGEGETVSIRFFHGAVGYSSFYICVNSTTAQSLVYGPISYLQFSEAVTVDIDVNGINLFLAENSNCANANMSALAWTFVGDSMYVGFLNIGISGSAVAGHIQPLDITLYEASDSLPDKSSVAVCVVNMFPDYSNVEFASCNESSILVPFSKNLSYPGMDGTVQFEAGTSWIQIAAISERNSLIAITDLPTKDNMYYIYWGVGILNDTNQEYAAQLYLTTIYNGNPTHHTWLYVVGIGSILLITIVTLAVLAVLIYRYRKQKMLKARQAETSNEEEIAMLSQSSLQIIEKP